jgi:hypothetical protein
MARLRKTLTDYLVIAISPALIMMLVGSLVYFLIAVYYHGGYPGRVSYIFGLFVFAAVLIARIAIEEGREYAMMYAIALGLAMLLVLGRFTSSTFLFNVVMLGVILWCADKLTWDCTVIDDQEDASGEGLLQTVGLDGSKETGTSNPSLDSHDLEATTSREPPPVPKTLWARFVEHRKRPHAPGVWVIYFSLAALPLFGIGQRFIPAENLEARRYAFKLLCIYTASGLGLLMTTSFLGLRRYLRQRRLEMPLEMASVWLTVGSVMIAALLFVCWLLPRPNAEYSITQVPFQVSSPTDLQASRHGWGNEGAQDKQQAQSAAAANKEQEGRPGGTESEGRGGQGKPQNGEGQGKSPGGQQGDGNQPGGQKPGGQNGEGKSSGGPSAGEGKSDKQSSGSQTGGKQGTKDQNGGQDKGQRSSNGSKQDQSESGKPSSSAEGGRQGGRNDRSGQKQSDREDSRSQAGASKPAGEDTGPQSSSDQKPSDSPSGAEPPKPATADDNPFESEVDPSEAPSAPSSWMPSPSEMLNSVLGLIPYGLKWLYNLIFLAIIAYLLWRNREQVLEALRNFWSAIRSFWENLFGVRPAEPAADEAATVAAAPPRPFADFPDPFATGDAQRWPPRDLVAYSFQALEAWGREHGCQRGPEQTPHEFAGCLADCETPLGLEAIQLADLYCCAAYSSGTLPRDRVGRLQKLWQLLRAVEPV